MNKILLTLSLTMLLAACGNSVEDKYIAACVIGIGSDSSDAKKLCSCTYDKLESQFGEKKLEEWANQVVPTSQKEADDFLKASLNATAQCMRKMGLAR